MQTMGLPHMKIFAEEFPSSLSKSEAENRVFHMK